MEVLWALIHSVFKNALPMGYVNMFLNMFMCMKHKTPQVIIMYTILWDGTSFRVSFQVWFPEGFFSCLGKNPRSTFEILYYNCNVAHGLKKKKSV